MILVYPMISSASVNPTLLPGIIKAVEKYIIIHNTDDVLNHFNAVGTEIAKAAGTAVMLAGASVAAAWVKNKAGSWRIKRKGKKLTLEMITPEELALEALPANIKSTAAAQ